MLQVFEHAYYFNLFIFIQNTRSKNKIGTSAFLIVSDIKVFHKKYKEFLAQITPSPVIIRLFV